MEIYTVGFTQKSAAEFFGLLSGAGIQRLIDVRLSNTSQLAAFAKRDDLAYFLKEILGAEYVHEPILAPTAEILDAFKKKKLITWAKFARDFNALMKERKVEEVLDKGLFAVPAVLLCSEPTAEHCHRRLVAEYLRKKWRGVKIIHL